MVRPRRSAAVAARVAAGAGKDCDAELLLANVQEPATFYEILTTRDPEAGQARERRGGPASAASRPPTLCRAAGVAFELEVALGEPANTLNEIVEPIRVRRDRDGRAWPRRGVERVARLGLAATGHARCAGAGDDREGIRGAGGRARRNSLRCGRMRKGGRSLEKVIPCEPALCRAV